MSTPLIPRKTNLGRQTAKRAGFTPISSDRSSGVTGVFYGVSPLKVNVPSVHQLVAISGSLSGDLVGVTNVFYGVSALKANVPCSVGTGRNQFVVCEGVEQAAAQIMASVGLAQRTKDRRTGSRGSL